MNKLVLFTLLLFMPMVSIAQFKSNKKDEQEEKPTNRFAPTPGSGITFTAPPDPAPIDGGIGWLLLAGTGFGISKLRRRKKTNDLS